MDVSASEAAVEQAHPEVEWLGGRPIPASLEQARALRAELWEARRAVYAAAAEALEDQVTALRGSVAYASASAPLVFVDLPSDGVAALAERPEVLSLGLEQGWRTFMSSAGVTVGANWTSGSGDQGNGVRVAVVEYANSSNTGDLAGQVKARYSTNGTIVTHIHPTWVAGAIASTSATWPGVAPGADIVSAATGNSAPGLSTDRAVIAATDWAISPSGGDADIVNTSFGQDTATGAEEARRYFDSVGWEDNRLVVASSGNFATFGNWNVVSPGTGYNVLTVGGRQRPQHRQHQRRHPLVFVERRELPRPRRDRLEPARRLQQAEPVGPGRQRANGERHDRRRDEHREPDRRRHRRPAHRPVAEPGELARGDPRDPDGRRESAARPSPAAARAATTRVSARHRPDGRTGSSTTARTAATCSAR